MIPSHKTAWRAEEPQRLCEEPVALVRSKDLHGFTYPSRYQLAHEGLEAPWGQAEQPGLGVGRAAVVLGLAGAA